MIHFSKYHGLGNDFIIVDADEVRRYFKEGAGAPLDLVRISKLAIQLCERKIGLGADGFIVVVPDPLEMLFFNSDGSMAPMCGNGIRCFTQYCYDTELSKSRECLVKTGAGELTVRIKDFEPFLVEVNMGKPDFNPAKSGIDTDDEDYLNKTIIIEGKDYEISTFFMGTIHTVLWVPQDMTLEAMEALGEKISNHPTFKEKTNVNMAKRLERQNGDTNADVDLVTYERGAGLTAACGTGATAVAVLGALQGKLPSTSTIQLKYGALEISQNADGEVFMTGPSEHIATGLCYL
ncbi:MAG: diaminopimelate epimerase [Clostridiales Family XIII bacterium]|jgi:diaminopimelate epimerase|nr:diaminopimelate epimerase [Clostridiales Family XIII bacterium]